ncbi:MAG: O-antigen ligase family protein [Nitrospiraceae bacterium]|nr:O-antigen ligase family protein [Nitrospiraceae bacterium]
MFRKEGGFGPPSFLLLALFFIIPISVFTREMLLWWAGTACLVLFFFKKPDNPFPLTFLSITFLSFVIFLGIHYYLVSLTFKIEVIFNLLFFTLAFIIFSRLNTLTIERFFKGSLFVFSLLVIWGLVQHFTGFGYMVEMYRRANAIFYTPNTFATGINFFLLPLIAAYLLGFYSKYVYILAILFFAGLLATQSRGGYLGFAAGLFFLAYFINIRKFKIKWQKIILGFLIVFLIFQLSPHWNVDRLKAETFLLENTYRTQLYSIAWKVIKTNPVFGYGFLNFGILFQRYKAPPLHEWNTLFVHNDYLQIWLEAGILGLLSLLALIAVFYITIFRNRKFFDNSKKSFWIYACCAAVSSMFVHALVDFPLYIPALQFLLGAYLGTINGIFRDKDAMEHLRIPVKEIFQRINIRYSVFKTLVIGIFLLWLLQPVIAQYAFRYSNDLLKKGETKSAIKYLAFAQRLAPYEAFYCFSEGIILRAQAVDMQRNDLAEMADKIFRKGMKANPYFMDNFLDGIRLNRDHRNLLKKPADNKEISDWINHTYLWSPHSGIVNIEYARTLVFLGQKKEAAVAAKKLQEKYPDEKMVQELIKDLKSKKIL